MADQPGIKLRMSSPYKGGTKVWSNTWYLTGPDWASQAQFDTLADEYKANAVTWFGSEVTILDATAYNGGSDLPVFSKSYNAAGTGAFTGNGQMPLEACMLVRGSTTARSTKNHPVYIMKFVHSVRHNSTSNGEVPLSGQKSALQGSVNEFVAGVSDGTNTRKWAGPRGAVVQSALVETYVTHRDFPT